LSSLQPPASSESREAIASWIVFNRKKCDGVCEGMLAYIAGCDGDSSPSSSARLMLLLRILRAVLSSNRAPAAGDYSAGTPPPPPPAADDKWAKSSALMRARLGEIVAAPLLRALARSSAGIGDGAARAACRDEVRSAVEEWGAHDAAFGGGGGGVWEGCGRGWTEALREADEAALAATSSVDEAGGGGDGVESTAGSDAIVEHAAATTTSTDGDDAVWKTLKHAGRQAPGIGEASGLNDATEGVDVVDEKRDELGESNEVVEATSSSSSFVEGIENYKAVPAASRDNIACVDVEIDFEVRLRSIFVRFAFLRVRIISM
jgi:hypothetical protein